MSNERIDAQNPDIGSHKGLVKRLVSVFKVKAKEKNNPFLFNKTLSEESVREIENLTEEIKFNSA